MYSLPGIMKALQVEKYPDRWNSIYNRAMEELEIRGAFFADENYIRRMNNEYELFDEWLDSVLAAAEKLRGNTVLIRYLYLLYYAMLDRRTFLQETDEIFPPVPTKGADSSEFDFALLFAVLPFVPAAAADMQFRGVPDAVYKKTLKMCKSCIISTEEITGKPGFSFRRFLVWIQLFIDSRILSAGRFNFEIYLPFNGCVCVFREIRNGSIKMLMSGVRLQDGMVFGSVGYNDEAKAYSAAYLETDEYFEGYPVGDKGKALKNRIRLPRSEWKAVLSPGEPVIYVHIPSARRSGRLDSVLCEQSYSDICEVMARCYPEHEYKAIYCASWLMDPQLEELLPPDSGIVKFQKKYMRYPRLSSGRDVFSFVYNNKHFERMEDLPEGTALLSALKQHFLSGKHIYEPGGLFFHTDSQHIQDQHT